MVKNSVVCTLFENDYHYGLAALTNSLYVQGFRGSIFAGYRGSLPKWSASSQENHSLLWDHASTLRVAEGLEIHFLPIHTEYHLTNYKPNFMLRLWHGPAKNADAIAYFDPDIVIKCKWEFFNIWMSHGVALVHEIVSNDMPPTHPLRKEWENVIYKCNKTLTRELHSYINGGFCGVSRSNIDFLKDWKEIFEAGIEHFNLTPWQWSHSYDRTYIFYTQDQDALNITAMCSKSPISEIGPEGMDFIPGGSTMSHALGTPKPWKKNFLLFALMGTSPSLAERAYWMNVEIPIILYSSIYIKFKRLSISLAGYLSRFYHRN